MNPVCGSPQVPGWMLYEKNNIFDLFHHILILLNLFISYLDEPLFLCLIPQSKTLSPTDSKCFSAANWYVCLFVCGRLLSLSFSPSGFFFQQIPIGQNRHEKIKIDGLCYDTYLLHITIISGCISKYLKHLYYFPFLQMEYSWTIRLHVDLLNFSPRQNVQVRSCCLKCWSYFCVLGP